MIDEQIVIVLSVTINKGIDFTDLPGIFRDKTRVSSIPAYFLKTESFPRTQE